MREEHLKRTVLALEICSGLKQSAVFWFGFFPLCLRTQCELLAQDRSIQSGRLQPRWGRGVTTVLRMVVNCMAWNMLFHHHPSGKRHWRWPMGPSQANCSWRGQEHASGHNAVVQCRDNVLGRVKGLASDFNAGTMISRSRLSHK